MTVYERFSDLLQKKGVKVADVTRATGIKSTVFSEWKKGKAQPKADKLQKIADYFEVPLKYLLTGSDETFEEASDKLDTEAGYLFYCLKEMGYTGDFEEDTFVIESFDKKERYVLSNQNYVFMTAMMKDVDKLIITRFLQGQVMNYGNT